ncbi:hypothetical protein B0H14DRAFT_2516895, partial [Mycena olivaceomarginata]
LGVRHCITASASLFLTRKPVGIAARPLSSVNRTGLCFSQNLVKCGSGTWHKQGSRALLSAQRLGSNVKLAAAPTNFLIRLQFGAKLRSSSGS